MLIDKIYLCEIIERSRDSRRFFLAHEVTVAIVIGQQIGDFREVHDNGFSIFIARAVLVGTSLVTIGKADSTLVAS